MVCQLKSIRYVYNTIYRYHFSEYFNYGYNDFLSNLANSLNDNGICLVGTPNITSDRYASKYSRKGHVNLKDYKSLKSIGDKYFSYSFQFGMNDEVIHTGFPQMAQFLWILCGNPKRK